MISYGIFETARNGGLFCVVRITSRRYEKWKNSEKGIARVNGNTNFKSKDLLFYIYAILITQLAMVDFVLLSKYIAGSD